jgi:hypothetical protein
MKLTPWYGTKADLKLRILDLMRDIDHMEAADDDGVVVVTGAHDTHFVIEVRHLHNDTLQEVD